MIETAHGIVVGDYCVDIRIEHLTRIAAVTLLVVGCLLVLQPFVTALLCAAIVCFSTWPMYDWLVKKLLP